MKFFIRTTILAIILLAITILLQRVPAFNFLNAFAYGSLVFFYVLTIVIISIVGNAVSRSNSRQFVSMITAAIAIKIFASIIFVLVFAIINKPSSILVVLPFFFYYVAFTIIEVAEMLRLNKMATTKNN